MGQVIEFNEHCSYTEQYGSITLNDLGLEGVPETLYVSGENLIRKSEYHITLINLRFVAELINPGQVDDLVQELLDLFREFIKHNDFDEFDLSNELRTMRDGKRLTVVVMAQVKSLENLFATIGEKYDKKIPVQPAHITLLIQPGDSGIPINSPEILAQNSQVFEADFAVSKASHE